MDGDNFASGSAPLPVAYKDRKTGLVVFGILTILLGGLSGSIVLLMLLARMVPAKTGPASDISTLLPAGCVYGCAAVVFIWLGIGSTLAKRWARALLLIVSWGGILVGILAFIFMSLTLPKMLSDFPAHTASKQLPANAKQVVMLVVFLIIGVMFVVLPAIWLFFYSSRHVKATCEARDPVRRWTDACPLPVLAVCLWSWVSAPTMLLLPLSGHGVMPFFGSIVTGIPDAIICVIVAVILAWGGTLLYRLDLRGWWIFIAGLCLMTVSYDLTFARHTMPEMYQLMNYPKAQIEQMQRLSFLTANSMMWWTTLGMLPFLGYLIWIKKYFNAGVSSRS